MGKDIIEKEEFMKVGAKRDKLIPRLYHAKIKDGNQIGIVYGLTSRKCTYQLLVKFGPIKYKYSMEAVLDCLVDENLKIENRFVRQNVNPKSIITDDCFIRAYSKLTANSWEDSFMELAKIACKHGYAMTDARVIDFYLKELGFSEMKAKKNVKVYDLADDEIDCIALIKGHAVAVKGGKYYDTSDCGFDTVNKYYVKSEK